MEWLWIAYSVAAALTAAVLLAAAAATGLQRRRQHGRDRILRERYLHIVMLSLIADERKPPHFPMLHHTGARQLLAEILAGVTAATYGLDTEPLRRIMEDNRVETWLLRHIRRSRGYRQAYFLALFSALPTSSRAAVDLAAYTQSRNRSVRFCALLVQLAADPSTALRRMSAYPEPFSGCEVAAIMALLRRGMLPIAYEPLLGAPSDNLRRVGLSIVRQFGIEEAEPQLLRMAAGDPSPELGREALYTLCSLHRPLSRPEVGRRLETMDATRRKSLLRHMALAGYAPAACGQLFDEGERPYYESLVQSYKRCLA